MTERMPSAAHSRRTPRSRQVTGTCFLSTMQIMAMADLLITTSRLPPPPSCRSRARGWRRRLRWRQFLTINDEDCSRCFVGCVIDQDYEQTKASGSVESLRLGKKRRWQVRRKETAQCLNFGKLAES